MTITKKPVYVGQYVDDLGAAFIGGLVANVHTMSISPPGWGKTAISMQIAEGIAPDNSNMIPISPSTPPSAISGPFDNEILIKESRFVRVVDGTPFDPEMSIVILDEALRGSDWVFDEVLHATDPTKQKSCVVWGTSNFVPSQERAQAMLDRFALWVWIRPEAFDVGDMVRSQMLSNGTPALPFTLPTLKDIRDVRAATPGANATNAVAEFIESLCAEAAKESYLVHPRQIAHWRKILYFNGVYHTGEADFHQLPEQAMKLMQWAWGSTSYEEAANWATLVKSIADKKGAAIGAILADAVGEFKRVAAIESLAERTKEAAKLGRLLSDAQSDINAIAPNDPRGQEAIARINKWFEMAVNGQIPTLGNG